MTSSLQEAAVWCELCGGRMKCQRMTRATSSIPGRGEVWRRHHLCSACGHEADLLVDGETDGPLVPQPRNSVDADDLAVSREDGEPAQFGADPVGE
jgi:hypothetical protein